MKYRVFNIAFLFTFTCFQVNHFLFADEVDVYFSPRGGCKQAIINEIENARSEILVAMYCLTEEEIALTLIGAKKRGVNVRIMVDRGQGKRQYSMAPALLNAGVSLKYSSKKGLFHHKFAVIDRNTLITGSFNWTKAAEERNRENLLILRLPAVVEKHIIEFQKLWGREEFDIHIVKCSRAFRKEIEDSIKIAGNLNAWHFLKSTQEYKEFTDKQKIFPVNIAKYFGFNIWEIAGVKESSLTQPTFWDYFKDEWRLKKRVRELDN